MSKSKKMRVDVRFAESVEELGRQFERELNKQVSIRSITELLGDALDGLEVTPVKNRKKLKLEVKKCLR